MILPAKPGNLSSRQHKSLIEQDSSSFGKAYFQLCQLYSFPVLTHVICHDASTLMLDVGRVHKDEEWTPILMALKKNRTLASISVYSEASHLQPRIREVGNRFQAGAGAVKSIFRILPDIMNGVRDGLLYNPHLSTLDISGISLRESTLKVLAHGLLNNTKINYLSLSRCQIGDSGIYILAPSLRTIKQLRILDLSGCALTEKGAHIVSAFLKSLAVRRQADCWIHSLRHSPMDYEPSQTLFSSDSAPKPLKRLIMCENELGDNGALPLFDLLLEEVGLSALDLQFNGLSEKSCEKALSVLEVNQDLVVLDLKNNDIGEWRRYLNSGQHSLALVASLLARNQRAKAIASHKGDRDLRALGKNQFLRSILFEEAAHSRPLLQTQSSVRRFTIPATPMLFSARKKTAPGRQNPTAAPPRPKILTSHPGKTRMVDAGVQTPKLPEQQPNRGAYPKKRVGWKEVPEPTPASIPRAEKMPKAETAAGPFRSDADKTEEYFKRVVLPFGLDVPSVPIPVVSPHPLLLENADLRKQISVLENAMRAMQGPQKPSSIRTVSREQPERPILSKNMDRCEVSAPVVIQGTLKEAPTNIDEMIGMLQRSVESFHKVLDQIEISS
ncbi:Centrosomal protein of 78 kDa [Kappamyces sp. JEL0680]|nr:Centrosomal protein of 78 kDa [Kappamyces sp. JEL0680]